MIEGRLTILRAPEPDDVGLLYEWENNTADWAPGEIFSPVSVKDLKALVEQSDLDIFQTRQMRLMIVEKANNQTIGCVDLFDFDPFNLHASIGILIIKPFRRQGYATDAVRTFCKYLFDYLGVNTVVANVSSDNAASNSLFYSCNFYHVGTYRNWIRRGMAFHDVELFQICRSDALNI